ncbi:hypothetical protein Gferi_26855 [Geosporobacter ferrireducens]|uniref:Uncharacterized protein n=2 Tax=Geosporobacter ferrireducens TaxID=1424294 RepID=A0A1D8GQX6_9FIRM|nr:hypothetical protein Gferi_26855 [Geosporobacter ferrireducens]
MTSYGEPNGEKKAIVITVSEVNFQDLSMLPAIGRLIDEGAIGLMNNRTSRSANVFKAYATLGSGVRAEASADSIHFVNNNEDSKDIYLRRMGINPGDKEIINQDMPRLQRLNLTGEYGAIAGALGQALNIEGIKTAAIGNSDTSDVSVRLAPLIVMNEQGLVDYGDVSQGTLIKDDLYPFGLKNNYPRMIEAFQEAYEKAGLVAIDFGDIYRLERYRDNMTDQAYMNHRMKILSELDTFVSQLLEVIDFSNTRLYLVTPYPSAANMKVGDRLTPILVVGAGIHPGILTSSTTRREGIVGNVDLAPSIAEYLGVQSENMTGRPLRSIERQNNLDWLLNTNQETIATSEFRYPVLAAFAIFEIFISISALLLILLKDRLKSNWVNAFMNLLLSTMAVPFVLLILSLIAKKSLFGVYLWTILITILITYAAKKASRHRLDPLIILSALTTIGLLVDIATQGRLIKTSLLGYDPIIGARYYGIGNEYMGVLIGSTLVFATALIDRFKKGKYWALFIFACTTLIVGFPGLGANVGGTITAVAAFTFSSLRLFNIKIRLKQILIIGFSTLFVVAFMAFIDMNVLGAKSHLAGAVEQLFNEGPGTIFLIINRKLSMNLRLIRVTIWSKVLISTILILAVLFYRPVGAINKLFKAYPNLSVGWAGIVAACVVGFLVNDSGVVASATGIIFLAMSMLYLTFFIPKENHTSV